MDKYTVVETDEYRNRVSPEIDRLFEEKFSEGINGEKYDCVFTFNYSPVISNNCKARHVPYIALVYDSPQVLLYSYTIINTCNYVFIFDKTQYIELKIECINSHLSLPERTEFIHPNLFMFACTSASILDKTCTPCS